MPVIKVKNNGVWEELGGNANTLGGMKPEEFATAVDIQNIHNIIENHTHDEFITIDTGLSVPGTAADSKAVGDALDTKQPKGDYATKSFVEDKIAEVESNIGDIDLSDYALKEDVPTKTSDLFNDSGYLTEHQSLEGLATESYVASQIAAIPIPDVSDQINSHNTAADSHNDIRLLVDGLTTRLNTLANSDDVTLDQMSEIVAYIKNNKTLIDGVTTNKINVSDIINNLTTNVDNKPLSAAQGVALKALIDAITVPTKLSQLTNDSGYITSYTETDPTVPSWAKTPEKPTYTADEVGADTQGTASSIVSIHDTNENAHSDIRDLIDGVTTRLDEFDSVSEGSNVQPVYFSNGKPVATTYTLGASVPSDAKFTDTTYDVATASTAGLMSAEDKVKLDGLGASTGIEIELDKSLSIEGMAADAKAVGDALVLKADKSSFDALSNLVGDTSVSKQIENALSDFSNDDTSNAIRYDVYQHLSNKNQKMARKNIGVVIDDVHNSKEVLFSATWDGDISNKDSFESTCTASTGDIEHGFWVKISDEVPDFNLITDNFATIRHDDDIYEYTIEKFIFCRGENCYCTPDAIVVTNAGECKIEDRANLNYIETFTAPSTGVYFWLNSQDWYLNSITLYTERRTGIYLSSDEKNDFVVGVTDNGAIITKASDGTIVEMATSDKIVTLDGYATENYVDEAIAEAIVEVYAQDDEPTDASEGSIWIDTDADGAPATSGKTSANVYVVDAGTTDMTTIDFSQYAVGDVVVVTAS